MNATVAALMTTTTSLAVGANGLSLDRPSHHMAPNLQDGQRLYAVGYFCRTASGRWSKQRQVEFVYAYSDISAFDNCRLLHKEMGEVVRMDTALPVYAPAAPNNMDISERPAATLPSLEYRFWQMRCESLAQKQELAAYAKQKGIRFSRSAAEGGQLGLAWNDCLNEVYSFSSQRSWSVEGFTEVTPDQFRAMCDAHANR